MPSSAIRQHSKSDTRSTATALLRTKVCRSNRDLRHLRSFLRKSAFTGSRKRHVGMILPNKFFTTDYGVGLRKLLAAPNKIERIVDFEDGQVFTRAGTYTCLLFAGESASENPRYARLGKIFRTAGKARIADLLRSGG